MTTFYVLIGIIIFGIIGYILCAASHLPPVEDEHATQIETKREYMDDDSP